MSSKIRCSLYPGYCPNKSDTCPNFHPINACVKPNCDGKTCTDLHLLCDLDSVKKICNSSQCNKMHPYAASKKLRISQGISSLNECSDDEFDVPTSVPPVNQASVTKSSPVNPLIDERIVRQIRDRISRENRTLIIPSYFSKGNCLVCWTRIADQFVEPCNHLVLCSRCVNFSKRCILCYTGITNTFNYAVSGNL